MITEKGIIDHTEGNKAFVIIKRSSACATCGSRGMCRSHGDREMFIEVTNHLQAKTGDHIEIKMPTGSFLKLSLLVYILPIVALIAGAYFGAEISGYLHFHSTPVSIAGGAIAMIIAFKVLRMIDRSVQSTEKYQPRMTRILVNAKDF